MCFLPANGRALACAHLDPLVRNHVIIAALALQAAGCDIGEAELVRHVDPGSLELLVEERLYGQVGRLLRRYLAALSADQRRALVEAQLRLGAELKR